MPLKGKRELVKRLNDRSDKLVRAFDAQITLIDMLPADDDDARSMRETALSLRERCEQLRQLPTSYTVEAFELYLGRLRDAVGIMREMNVLKQRLAEKVRR